MLVAIVNPNTTESMTRGIASAAHAVASAGTDLRILTAEHGPESIEGFYDEAFAVPGLIARIRQHDDVDAWVIACFDDTGLDAARCVAEAPVIGIGEAGAHMATLVATRFSVVTPLSRTIPALDHNLQKYGLRGRCASIRASEVPVLELESGQGGARAKISAEIAAAIRDDGAEAVVLGCAGMTALARSLEDEHGIPVIDGVAAAVRLAEATVGLGLRTSRRGGYARPRPKTYSGWAGEFAP